MINFIAMPTLIARVLQTGGRDAYGNLPERHISDGDGTPCRHCLKNVDAGEPYLILAYRPFGSTQAFAETGPIFLHAEACRRADDKADLPAILDSPDYIVRGYGGDERLVYGTGAVTPTNKIADYAADLLSRDDIASVHVRSARNNCFQCRIVQA